MTYFVYDLTASGVPGLAPLGAEYDAKVLLSHFSAFLGVRQNATLVIQPRIL